MQILTLENTTYLLNKVPDEVDEDMRFSVLDNSDPKNPDFFFVPLIYLESFSSPSAVLEILPGNTQGDVGGKIQMPLDWHVLLGDPECGDLEILPLTSLSSTCSIFRFLKPSKAHLGPDSGLFRYRFGKIFGLCNIFVIARSPENSKANSNNIASIL